LAGRVVWVAVDLARERLEDALGHAGFDRHAPTTWVWEGVVPYLSATAVRGTSAALSSLSAPGSRLVVNYQDRSVAAWTLRAVMRLVLRVARQPDPMAGERWLSLWSPAQMRTMLADNGFEVTRDDDLLTLSSGLDLPMDNVPSLRNGRVALAVRNNG
jgi:methyltransferase (TIGR00027 family)